jgi:hypothetical protein
MSTHYHVLSGDHGCMPDMNQVYETEREAIEGLRDWQNDIYDSCEVKHPGRCHFGSYKFGFIDFKPGHGTEYSEVSDCEEDCLEGWSSRWTTS